MGGKVRINGGLRLEARRRVDRRIKDVEVRQSVHAKRARIP
jgi:anti-sigma-K factor RskA